MNDDGTFELAACPTGAVDLYAGLASFGTSRAEHVVLREGEAVEGVVLFVEENGYSLPSTRPVHRGSVVRTFETPSRR
jgi:hypothetical protein